MSGPLDIMRARAGLYRRAAPTRAYLDYVRINGLGLKSLRDFDPIGTFCGCLAVLSIRRNGSRFVFASDSDVGRSEPAAVIEAFGRDGQTTVDLVAWPVKRPGMVLSMFGVSSMLGVWNVHRAGTYVFDQPLVVYRTPLEWLRAGCRGVAVVVPDLAAREMLDAPGRISGQDQKHSEELARMVATLFDRSRFVAPVQQREAA